MVRASLNETDVDDLLYEFQEACQEALTLSLKLMDRCDNPDAVTLSSQTVDNAIYCLGLYYGIEMPASSLLNPEQNEVDSASSSSELYLFLQETAEKDGVHTLDLLGNYLQNAAYLITEESLFSPERSGEIPNQSSQLMKELQGRLAEITQSVQSMPLAGIDLEPKVKAQAPQGQVKTTFGL